ncbi:thiosulfate ABC transporter substrate-binding protein CysP [Cardiobacterium sp. Marseille-Q4385]|uniref:thiosulfate ABC transporter substrate-binding protein CysP n=1 Tax=Cardiobacterium sp. Marseille-Q4385 TaxID=2866573 RepID=UPI001CE44C10|nr:thiosulfate ABC transporter substrate-binding protein CysP [Cardiobacterium sp. Marseille-Q4385]
MKKILLAALFAASALPTFAADKELLNASYDIARELFVQYNALYQKEHPDVKITQSHAGSSKQANAILQGLKADVVTFNQVTDIDVLAQKGKLLPENWRERLPHHSSPYYSTTAFLVRKGNPKHIENWGDLVKDGVEIVFANPKTSGNGRYAYLGALGYAQDAFKSEAEQHNFLKNVLGHVKVFDTGGRGATTSFVERKIGDVLITFESEVHGIRQEYGADDYDVVIPKVSILAEFPVAWLDKNTEAKGTTDTAKDYLKYLYSEPAQRLLAENHYRVRDEKVAAAFKDRFPELKLKTIEDISGSWDKAMKEHFASGALLDQLQKR